MSSPYDELREGSRLGPYELLIAVAQGGMARVWAARHEPSKLVVALKTIRPEFASNRTYQRLFQDEARFASAVNHPSVCAIHGIGEDNGVLYIAMEWVVGESVARILKPTKNDQIKPIEPRIGAKIIADSCEPLHAAHEVRDDEGSLMRLVHCDVSPQNLMITSDGRAKLV